MEQRRTELVYLSVKRLAIAVRHHLTRLIREIYRLNEHHFKKGLDIIFIVRVNAKKIDYHTLEKALMHVADIHRVLEKSRNEQNE